MNTVYNREHMNRNEGLNQAQAVRQSTIRSRFEELDKAVGENTELLNQVTERIRSVLNPLSKSESLAKNAPEPPKPPLTPMVETLENLTERVRRNNRDLNQLLETIEL